MKKYGIVFLGLFLFMLSGCGLLLDSVDSISKKSGNSQTESGLKPTPQLKKGTQLTISNQSAKTLYNLRYSGVSSHASLRPGDSCTIDLGEQQGTGSIFFELDAYRFKTNDVILIENGKTKTFTFYDTTVIIDLISGKEKALSNYDNKTTLNITNDSSKKLTDIKYTGEKPSGTGDLAAGESCTITLTNKVGRGAVTFKIGKNELRTQAAYSLDKGEEKAITLTNTTPVIDSSGNRSILGSFFDDTVLAIRNTSIYTLTAIRYSGEQPTGNFDLPGNTMCEIYLNAEGSGSISFEIEGKAVKTTKTIVLPREQRKEFVISDDTEIVNIESGLQTTVGKLYPDTVLTIENSSTKVLYNVRYSGKYLESELYAGTSSPINLGKNAGNGSISFMLNGTHYVTVDTITLAKGEQSTFIISGSTLVKQQYGYSVQKQISEL